MAVLAYNEILPKTIIDYNDAPYVVLSSHIFRMQKRKPVNQTKIRNIITGQVLEIPFHQSETVNEAETDKLSAVYLYANGKEAWFAEEGKPQNRFSFPYESVADQVQWLTPNSVVDVLTYEEKPVTITIPVKVDLEVKDAPPAVKGNTVSGGTKLATLSTGAKVNVPLFINPGDIVRINTDSGEYTERMEKA